MVMLQPLAIALRTDSGRRNIMVHSCASRPRLLQCFSPGVVSVEFESGFGGEARAAGSLACLLLLVADVLHVIHGVGYT